LRKREKRDFSGKRTDTENTHREKKRTGKREKGE